MCFSETLTKSFEHANKADLCLAMGSSLTVTPAADIPEVQVMTNTCNQYCDVYLVCDV